MIWTRVGELHKARVLQGVRYQQQRVLTALENIALLNAAVGPSGIDVGMGTLDRALADLEKSIEVAVATGVEFTLDDLAAEALDEMRGYRATVAKQRAAGPEPQEMVKRTALGQEAKRLLKATENMVLAAWSAFQETTRESDLAQEAVSHALRAWHAVIATAQALQIHVVPDLNVVALDRLWNGRIGEGAVSPHA